MLNDAYQKGTEILSKTVNRNKQKFNVQAYITMHNVIIKSILYTIWDNVYVMKVYG